MLGYKEKRNGERPVIYRLCIVNRETYSGLFLIRDFSGKNKARLDF